MLAYGMAPLKSVIGHLEVRLSQSVSEGEQEGPEASQPTEEREAPEESTCAKACGHTAGKEAVAAAGRGETPWRESPRREIPR